MDQNLQQSGLRHAIDFVLASPFELAFDLAQVIDENPEGFTWSPKTRQLVLVDHPDAYFVAREGHEKWLRCLPPDGLDLVDWIVKASDRLCHGGEFCGGWRDENGLYFLDVTVVVQGLEAAIAFGLENNQDYIYHPLTGKSIDIRRRRRRSA